MSNNVTSAHLAMPLELRLYTLQNCKNLSPYNGYASGSFYSQKGKTWGNTPDGIIRVSDHWNFYSRGEMHCITDLPKEILTGKWVVAKYNAATGVYNVIAADEKDTAELKKREQRNEKKNSMIDYSEIRRKREALAAKIASKKTSEAREKKIKAGTLWAEVNVNVWLGSGRRVRFGGTETLVGQITYESKTSSTFCINVNGIVREIRKCNSFKTLNRKPYTRKAA